MYKVGDKVVVNGYLGQVVAVCGGELEVRTGSGVGGVSADDVEPIEVWAHMCAAAKSDMRKARKEGSISICQTRRGLVDLTYDAATRMYEATHEGRFVTCGSARDMVERLASVYRVVTG